MSIGGCSAILFPLLFLFFFLLVAECSSACSLYDGTTPGRIESDLSEGCAVVRDNLFEDMSSSIGGAIRVERHSSLRITDCTFVNCRAYQGSFLGMPMYGWGGACYLESTMLNMTRCCGASCSAEAEGQFLDLTGTSDDESVAAESRQISETSVVSCGRHDDDDGSGGILVRSWIAAQFWSLNITSCQCLNDGAAFHYERTGLPYSIRYTNVANCFLSSTIFTNHRSGYPTLEYVNFINNDPFKSGGTAYLLYDRGLSIRHGIFNNNSGSLASTGSAGSDFGFNFDFCYFWPSGPSAVGVTIGSNCFTTMTASYWIIGVNTAACPGAPSGTGSLSPSPLSLSHSSPQTASPQPSPAESESLSGSPISSRFRSPTESPTASEFRSNTQSESPDPTPSASISSLFTGSLRFPPSRGFRASSECVGSGSFVGSLAPADPTGFRATFLAIESRRLGISGAAAISAEISQSGWPTNTRGVDRSFGLAVSAAAVRSASFRISVGYNASAAVGGLAVFSGSAELDWLRFGPSGGPAPSSGLTEVTTLSGTAGFNCSSLADSGVLFATPIYAATFRAKPSGSPSSRCSGSAAVADSPAMGQADQRSLSGGAIAALVVGLVVLVGLIAALAGFMYRRTYVIEYSYSSAEAGANVMPMERIFTSSFASPLTVVDTATVTDDSFWQFTQVPDEGL
jgi:hypothetical protein